MIAFANLGHPHPKNHPTKIWRKICMGKQNLERLFRNVFLRFHLTIFWNISLYIFNQIFFLGCGGGRGRVGWVEGLTFLDSLTEIILKMGSFLENDMQTPGIVTQTNWFSGITGYRFWIVVAFLNNSNEYFLSEKYIFFNFGETRNTIRFRIF